MPFLVYFVGWLDTSVSLVQLLAIVQFKCEFKVIWMVFDLAAKAHGAEHSQVDTLTNWAEWMTGVANKNDIITVV